MLTDCRADDLVQVGLGQEGRIRSLAVRDLEVGALLRRVALRLVVKVFLQVFRDQLKVELGILFFKYGPNPTSFCLFSSFSQCNDKYCTKFDYIKA